MTDSDYQQCLRIAKEIETFSAPEIKVLDEVLCEYKKNSKDGYILFEERFEGEIVGFVIFGMTPLTVFGWDIYWMAVDKDYQGKGFGRRLLKRVEEHVMKHHDRANLRVETSTRKEYAHARNLYCKQGFVEAGRIIDFYDKGDDLIIFYKMLERNLYQYEEKSLIHSESHSGLKPNH